MDVNDFYKHGSSLDMPKRPYWDYTMTKEQVLANEERAFREYLQKVWSCGCMSWWGFLVALWLVVAWFLVPLVSLHPSCAFFFFFFFFGFNCRSKTSLGITSCRTLSSTSR